MTLEAAVAAAGYELVNLAARGATGSVYRATSLESGEQVALKVLAEATDETADRVAALAGVKQQNVMQVSEVLSLEDETAIVSAWVEGSTLAELLLRHGALSEARSEIVVSSVLDGLAALHDAGVAHGSVSAENILVDDDDVTLIDFGLGSPTATDSGNQPTLFANDRANVGQLARLLLQNKAVNEPPQWRVAAIENAETGRFSGIDEMRSALLPSRRARLQLEREPSERPPLVLPFLVGLGVVFLTIGAFLLLGPDNDDQPAPTITGIEQDEQP